MSGGSIHVDPAVLRSAVTSFGPAADGLGRLTADAPLVEAAAAVSALQTAVACRDAASEVAAEVAAVCDEARGLSAAANAIEKLEWA
jgi:hypothetical protein